MYIVSKSILVHVHTMYIITHVHVHCTQMSTCTYTDVPNPNKHVQLFFQNSLFSKCDICTKFSKERLKRVSSSAEAEYSFQKEYSLHLQTVRYDALVFTDCIT